MIVGYYKYAENGMDWTGRYDVEYQGGEFEPEYEINFPDKNVQVMVGFLDGEDREPHPDDKYGSGRVYQFFENGELVKTVFFGDDFDAEKRIPIYFDENPHDFGLETALIYIYDYFKREDPFIVLVHERDERDVIFIEPIPQEREVFDYETIESGEYDTDKTHIESEYHITEGSYVGSYGDNRLEYLQKNIEYIKQFDKGQKFVNEILERFNDAFEHCDKDE